jgi:DNA repair protein RadC
MRLNSSRTAFAFFQKNISTEVEEFWIAALNPGLEILDKKLLFRGTVDSCMIHPRDMIRFLCLQNATSFLIAHNHPSGDSRPSRSDIQITKRILYLSCILEIPMNDHLILAGESYFSFADRGLIRKYSNYRSFRRSI